MQQATRDKKNTFTNLDGERILHIFINSNEMDFKYMLGSKWDTGLTIYIKKWV